MAAIGGKADILRTSLNVRFWTKADKTWILGHNGLSANDPTRTSRTARSDPFYVVLFAMMNKDELIIQLIKIALGIAIGAYFVWWSLEVLHRLPSH
jgi:hypothetical protein